MLALVAAVAFLVGMIVSHAIEHISTGLFWIFIGLILLSLHEAFGGVIMECRHSSW